jgi:hypothetical protein
LRLFFEVQTMNTESRPSAAETLLQQLKTGLKAGLGSKELIVLSTMAMEACHDPEMGIVSDLSRAEIAKRAGLTFNQVAKCLEKLVDAGAIARRQMEKRAGESAMTMLCGVAGEILGLGSEADVPSDLAPELRSLLIGKSAAFRMAVAEAWRSESTLPPGVRDAFHGPDWEFRKIDSFLRDRSLTAMEAVSSALVEQRKAIEAEGKGLYAFECEDGTVIIDRNALVASKQAAACIDLAFVRGVTDRLLKRKKGMVTVAKLPTLVSEIGYSRLLGFVSRHDAAKAEAALLSTMTRGTWSRPRGIKDAFYTVTASAVAGRYPQGCGSVAANCS